MKLAAISPIFSLVAVFVTTKSSLSKMYSRVPPSGAAPRYLNNSTAVAGAANSKDEKASPEKSHRAINAANTFRSTGGCWPTTTNSRLDSPDKEPYSKPLNHYPHSHSHSDGGDHSPWQFRRKRHSRVGVRLRAGELSKSGKLWAFPRDPNAGGMYVRLILRVYNRSNAPKTIAFYAI